MIDNNEIIKDFLHKTINVYPFNGLEGYYGEVLKIEDNKLTGNWGDKQIIVGTRPIEIIGADTLKRDKYIKYEKL